MRQKRYKIGIIGSGFIESGLATDFCGRRAATQAAFKDRIEALLSVWRLRVNIGTEAVARAEGFDQKKSVQKTLQLFELNKSI